MASRKQVPRLMRGGLSNRVYVVTRYRELGNGSVEALEKHDVTEDFELMIEERKQPVGSWVTEETGPAGTSPAAKLSAVRALGESWVGLDSSHEFGDALLKIVGAR